jgi:hypothetical protein
MYKYMKEYIIHLDKNELYEKFIINEYNNIEPINIYKILYDKL